MRKTLLSTLIASLFSAAPALAQTDDPMRVQGSATIGGIYNNVNATDTAKLQEYQDLGNGALSSVGAQGRNSTTWFQGYGENFGRSDQYMFLRGGMYDVFKTGAYLNDMPHNFASPALTPYTGVGSGLLVGTFPQLSTSQWNSFNLGYERRDAGGYFEWQKNSPWYFRADGSQVTFDGTKNGAAALGTSPGNGYADLPFPTQYTTSNWGVEGGYQTSKMTFAARWDYSKFDNAIGTVYWTNPFFGNQLDASQQAPDNEFNKFTLTGNYRGLPWNSVISARYTYSQTTSNVGLATTQLNSATPATAYQPTYPSEGTFNGKNVNQSFALGWTANPVANVDSRFYYYWTKLDGKSDQVEYGDAPTPSRTLPSGLGCGSLPGPTPASAWIPGNCENEIYSYTKNDVGFDVWWRFARGQRLGFGWDYWNLDQTNAPGYDAAHANKFFLEYKNTMWDKFGGKLKYTYIKRDADPNWPTNVEGGANNPEYLNQWTSQFNLQDATINAIKLNLDWNPMQNLGFAFEGLWSKTDYDDVTYGRTSTDRQGYFLSGNWTAANGIMVNGFGSWEQVKYPSGHRYIGTVSNGPPPTAAIPNPTPPGWCPLSGTVVNPNCFSPFVPPFWTPTSNINTSTASYNWNSSTEDTTWMIGVGMDWPINQQWFVKASYIYVNNDGKGSFSSQNNLGNPQNIPTFDDSTQQSLNLKAIYTLNKNWSFTGGYAYEKWKWNSVTENGYVYTIPSPPVANNTGQSYGNGYMAFTDGNQNIFYLTATYKFDAPPLPVAKVAQAPAPAPVVAPPPPPPKPAPPPPPPPQVQKITLDSKVLFDFDKAVLKPEGAAAIDSQVVSKLSQVQKLEVVLVSGHTDPLGSDAYNQKLSERRADAVRDYLVSKGVPKDKIETLGLGEKQPVPGLVCEQKNLKEKIACLQPDRRVVIEVKGETVKR